ncbi:MAG TPA: alpha-hydroxy acid oxidase, partial [Solirubrobacteraceae bacterium]
MTERRLPRWSEVRPLLAPRAPELDRTARRLARAASIPDLRAIARRRTPRPVFDYADGAAEREIGLRRSRQAFERVELIPRALEDVSAVDTATEILGRRAELPLAFAPTGYTRLFHHEGERAVARVAERGGIPTGLSTVGTTTIEALAAAAPGARKWFQVYVLFDRDAVADLVARAQAAGFEALILTVDVSVAGSRLRDVHNQLTFPPNFKALADIALRPAWWANMLTTE